MIATNKENNVILKKERQDRLSKDYEAVPVKYEYYKYVGEHKYLIYTQLAEKQLLEMYSEELKKYEPYFVVSGKKLYRARVFITRKEDRLRHAIREYEDIFGYEEAVFECIHFESQDRSKEPSEIVVALYEGKKRMEEYKRVREALEILTPIQKRRIIAHFYEGKSSRTIAKEEGVNYSKVDKSINAALKKMRNFLEQGGAKVFSTSK